MVLCVRERVGILFGVPVRAYTALILEAHLHFLSIYLGRCLTNILVAVRGQLDGFVYTCIIPAARAAIERSHNHSHIWAWTTRRLITYYHYI